MPGATFGWDEPWTPISRPISSWPTFRPAGGRRRGRGQCRQVRPRYRNAVTVVLVTGMSGTGKSAALAELALRGHQVVDTDYGAYSEQVPCSDAGESQQLWREDRIKALLDAHDGGALFISGCVSNQATFYPRFDAIVLLSAPATVVLERVARRESNAFGKRDVDRDRILHDLADIEPLLRARATAEIDTRAPLAEVADALERIAEEH